MSKLSRLYAVAASVQIALLVTTPAVQAQGVARSSADMPPPAWPETKRNAAAPSVLLIMTDDVGFGTTSTFGGPVPMPAFDALAAQGLRYNRFHTTGICSPSRAALLTGRNPTSVAMGTVTDGATSYEGYTSILPKSAATIAEHLKQAGYGTAMFGKHHLTPQWEQGAAGPFDRWPTGLGFEYFYGFHPGDTNQYAPVVYENTQIQDVPVRAADYIFDKDMANHAIRWMGNQKSAAPNKPFFVYYAPGTAHAPHHAPKEWIAKFKGQYDQGWDKIREETFARQKAMGVIPKSAKLSARPAEIPAWNTLTPQQKRVYSRQMEVFAASLAYADYQMGRVIDAARKQSGGNLMVVYVQGDNGASAEAGIDGTLNEHGKIEANTDTLDTMERRMDDMGGPMALNHYSIGWAHAMNTPFPWVKQLSSHLGATRNGMVISWPGKIDGVGGVRSQFHHLTDVAPTILEAAGVTPADTVNGTKQQPFDGISMSYTLNASGAPSRRTTQIFNMWDNFAIYHNGWMASTTPESFPWKLTTPKPLKVEGRNWELYNLDADFSQATDVSAKNGGQTGNMLTDLIAMFWTLAEQAKALPINRPTGLGNWPNPYAGMTSISLAPDSAPLPDGTAPRMLNRSFEIVTDVTLADSDTNGVMLAQGGRFNGYSFYLKDGRPTFHYNVANIHRYTVTAPNALPAGTYKVTAKFDYDGGFAKGGTMTILVNGEAVASGRIERTLGARVSLDETMDVGRDRWTPVTEEYASPFAFTGQLDAVRIELR